MNISKEKILFAILAGGQSKRFGGGYKTFTKISGKTMLNHIIKILTNFSNDIIINANNLDEFKDLDYPIVQDYFKGFLGPLAGIHSSILWTKNNHISKEWVFTVPSDTPFLPENILEKFCNKIKTDSEILIARSNNKIHPVVSMWNINLFKSIEIELNQNRRKIMTWVEKHNFTFVDFDYQTVDPFFNVNTIEDLKIAENFNQFNA